MQDDVAMMYQHAGLDISAPAAPEKKELISGDLTNMENVAIASAEASIDASVQAVRVKLSAPENELHDEVGKLVAALEQTRTQIESMADPSRIHSTHKLAMLIHEASQVIAELDKKPAMREYLANAGVYSTLMALRSHLKK